MKNGSIILNCSVWYDSLDHALVFVRDCNDYIYVYYVNAIPEQIVLVLKSRHIVFIFLYMQILYITIYYFYAFTDDMTIQQAYN